jgi:predicted TIM-barrel fold metal-dependent hydrolase
MRKYPDTFYWFCNIDPREGGNSPDTDFSYFLDYYVEKGAKGIGEITSNLYFDDPRVLNLFKHVEKKGIPLTFHMAHKMYDCYGLIDDLGMPRLEKALKMFPGLKFLAHSQTFWAHMSSDVTEESRKGYPTGRVNPGRVYELMKKYPNLLGDLSAGSGFNAITRDPEFGYAFLEEFNERLFFGTDICAPSNYTQAFFGFSLWFDNALENGKISARAYENICRNNALKLLGEDVK